MKKLKTFLVATLCAILALTGYVGASTDLLTLLHGQPDKTVQTDRCLGDKAKEFHILGKQPKATGEYVDQITTAKIVRVVDGDTLLVEIKGEEYKVRLIGVDTPEVYGKAEFYGREASDYVKSLLQKGQEVYLQRDVSDTDRYGRLLRYVWLEKPIVDTLSRADVEAGMLNGILVSKGYAAPATFPPDVKYEDIFAALGEKPREEGIGLWKKAENRETGKTVAVV
ncbi:thermonuclease family protein [Peptococcus niger]|uniref:Endonuclease YncB, thermonuclease family n=1 Tax=Peptococcus niger TaxID=2741 RepID=A0A1G6W0I1_PEPNI|nr:thermonuclease family protein [Peptococcus niger]SDD58555.1 Endonuclease YncB, thermonuclease family [Peptococcus niger]